ncbi:MAG: aminopeptidase P N-terminal domain-containing protein [Dehalococcoidia bacterium]|jgi:Xaa-Pro aminopeptidase|nr:aminopeptidase P N-terminal domain-containing protein [Dehalococcoidia bacterium]
MADEFAARRQRLMRSMRPPGGGSAAVFAAGHEALRNGDVHYPFRQTSTFYYLTGFEEPDAVAVLRPGADEPYTLFVRPRDPATAIWDGPRAGVDGAIADHGADAAYPIEELDARLPRLLAGAGSVYFSIGSDEQVGETVTGAVERRRSAPNAVQQVTDPFPLVAAMRLRKSAQEVRLLQQAVDVTGAGIAAAIAATRPGMHEYEVKAVLDAEYRRRGATHDGFPAIVASGANCCVLHYPFARDRIENGDLLLIDTGAECGYYGADVTRTFPASGRFTPAQREVYQIVLDAQSAAIETIEPGVAFDEVHGAALRVLVAGLRSLGVLSGRSDRLIRDDAYRPYFMHGTSHWLGLDVHDVGKYRDGDGAGGVSPTVLRPGMVLTVEPGLYFGAGARAPRRLKGIGVRIEDDVLVTRGGRRNLSAAIPSDPDELEAMVGSAT